MDGGGYIVIRPVSFTQHTSSSPYNSLTRLSHMVGKMVNNQSHVESRAQCAMDT